RRCRAHLPGQGRWWLVLADPRRRGKSGRRCGQRVAIPRQGDRIALLAIAKKVGLRSGWGLLEGAISVHNKLWPWHPFDGNDRHSTVNSKISKPRSYNCLPWSPRTCPRRPRSSWVAPARWYGPWPSVIGLSPPCTPEIEDLADRELLLLAPV